jgi:hypothetical protein
MMKIYRSDMYGIDVWRLSGVIEMDDTRKLARTIVESDLLGQGCMIIDFENVDHIDYRALQLLESWLPNNADILLSGLNDYLLDIFAFIKKRNVPPIYPDWRKALHYLMTERGKVRAATAAVAAGNK